MENNEIIKYQLPNEIIKHITKKKDIYNIILVCKAWYQYGIKVLYKDFSYEYTLLKVPTASQLEWVKHYHTWIDAAEEKRNFQLYTLIQGMKRLESIHIDIFGHIKYFKKYRNFLYKFAELKKDQIKKLHISLDILDDKISNNSLIKFKDIFTQFIKIFKTLDILILETGEENPFVDIQRLMIECLTNVYDNRSAESRTIISDTDLSVDENSNNRHMLDKLIIYDNNSVNIEESLSDIISKVPLRKLTIRSYISKQHHEPTSSVSRCAEPFWRINRYKKEIVSKYPEYFTSLASENQKSILNGNQFTDYESFCNRSNNRIWRKLYYVYYENLKKRIEHENGSNSSDSKDSLLLHSSLSSTSSSSSIINKSNSSTLDTSCSSNNSFSEKATDHKHSFNLTNNSIINTSKTTTNTTSKLDQDNNQYNYHMKSLCLENCQSISVKLFTIIVSKLSHLSTIKLDNISYLPEFCVMKLLIGSGKNLLHLELNMASHQLTTDIIVCIATENVNLNTLCLKSYDDKLKIDVEIINWMLTLCDHLYLFSIENANDNVHEFYQKNYNYQDSSYHCYKKTILNKTVISRIQKDTLFNFEKLMNNM
ncbi:hypothetical protein BCR36DRAFT_396002 [Piromyces finnis]|uniref:F-box domain-containing protein n=1 Tax=Piromyces finnis TaxID=1754191 RepID=A0A1Y1VGF4_9FUNG|nr:hypothetical protein BCR36DRAFT_396002 [Piromyces finnis]|eukprot:ORX55439.1 hypothetical protein BCR36DRAFT_396002 [Piromyces finnis]